MFGETAFFRFLEPSPPPVGKVNEFSLGVEPGKLRAGPEEEAGLKGDPAQRFPGSVFNVEEKRYTVTTPGFD
jgi:hypothetical protein